MKLKFLGILSILGIGAIGAALTIFFLKKKKTKLIKNRIEYIKAKNLSPNLQINTFGTDKFIDLIALIDVKRDNFGHLNPNSCLEILVAINYFILPSMTEKAHYARAIRRHALYNPDLYFKHFADYMNSYEDLLGQVKSWVCELLDLNEDWFIDELNYHLKTGNNILLGNFLALYPFYFEQYLPVKKNITEKQAINLLNVMIQKAEDAQYMIEKNIEDVQNLELRLIPLLFMITMDYAYFETQYEFEDLMNVLNKTQNKELMNKWSKFVIITQTFFNRYDA